MYPSVLEEEEHAFNSGNAFPLAVLVLQLDVLGDVEQKSLGGRRQRTTCSSQHRGKQEAVSGVQIHPNSELFGSLEKSQMT